MKKQTTTFALTSIMLCLCFSQNTNAQVNWSCKNAYSSSKLVSNEPYPAFESIKSNELKNIETKISDLETKMRPLGFKKTTLEREAEGNNIFIPYYLRTPKLKETEDKLRTEKLDLGRDERQLIKFKDDKNDAEQFLVKKEKGDPGFLSAFGSGSRFGFKTWKAEDLVVINEKVEFYNNNIRIRKLNVEFYEKSIKVMESEINVGLVADAKKELEKIKLEIEELSQPIKDLQAKKAQLENLTRIEATKLLKRSLKDARLTSPITDLLGYYALDTIPKSNKVTLLIGNNLNNTKKIDYEMSLEIKTLVEKLVKRKYYIVFDTESNYATYISQLAGSLGIPVSAKSNESFKDHQNSVVINNDYLRMQILGDAKSVVISTDSITGIGLFSEGLATHVLKVKNKFETMTLNNWVADLTKRTRNLGITAKPITQVNTAKEIFAENLEHSYSKSSSLKNEVTDFRPFSQFTPENLSLVSIEKVLNEAISFSKVMDQNVDTGGSVIFGSSREDKFSANLIYQTAHKLGSLGISVATGGAGGAMEIANAGAWNSGGRSIGIPIGGKHTLDTEKNIATSIHTKTITTSGYQERIPALLGEGIDSRKLIIFAPGGNGTIKELATTLVRSSGKFDQINKIVFLDSDYYGPLVTWLQKSDLPQALKEKIVMYNTVEEFNVLAQKMQTTDEKALDIKPRKDQLTYEVKTKIYDDYNGPSHKKDKKSKYENYDKKFSWED